MLCPSCQTANPDGTKFCMECGTPLALSCPACGATHAPGQKFCGECGATLAVLASSPAPAVSPTAPVPSAPAPVAATEMRLVSVLFVDLVGFTSLSESRDAEDVRELLGRYFDDARTIVERYGGTIEKFIGDAVMAVWGVPVAREDDAERAVRAALDVIDAVSVFGASSGAPDLRARAGVVTGQVAALENPGEGLVVGDRVNTASRVQSAAQPGSVFVDEVTRSVTSAAIAYEDGGEHTVKGKADPLHLWRATRVVAGVGGSQRTVGIDPPFVGREGDLRLLKDLFHNAGERRSARLVVVTGEAGVGKSRLRQEFFQYVDGLADSVLWHSGRCLSYGEGIAYWALAEMVRQRLGIPEDAPHDEAREKLDAGLARWLPDAADREFVAPRLGALIGIAEPRLGREELFAGWRMFFERLAEHLPVALVFEDVQWADAGLLDFITQLLDWSAQSPIFVLVLARPELAARHRGWPAGLRAATLLPLEPLDDEAMRQLLAGVLIDAPRTAVEQIVARAEGVPLYAVETLRALVDRGVLAERDGRLSLTGELGELDIPPSLGSLLAARIDGLEPDEQQLVKALSVFGGSFPRASALVLGGVSEDDLDGVLAALVRKGVLAIRSDPLSPERGQFTFAQGLFRTVAYEMLSRAERRARHLAAAEHLRAALPNDGEEVAEAIAVHLLDALRAGPDSVDAEELSKRTVAALRRAAGRARTVGAPEAGVQNLMTARELVSDPGEYAEITKLAAQMATEAGRYEQALELWEEAAAHEGEPVSAHVVERIGDALRRLGRMEEATERLTTALATIGSDHLDADVGELSATLGGVLSFAGELDQAGPVLDRALRIAEDLGLPTLLARALNGKATLMLYTDRSHEAQALFGAAIEVARRHDLTQTLSIAENNLGALYLRTDLAEAEAHLTISLGLARQLGNRHMESMCVSNLGYAHLLTGRWDELAQMLSELLDDNEAGPGHEMLYQSLAVLQALRGDTEGAASSLERLDGWRDSEDADLRGSQAAAAAVVSLSAGRADEAVEHGLRGLPDVIGIYGAGGDSVRIGWADAVRAAVQVGRIADAQRLLELITDLPPGRVPAHIKAHVRLSRGLIAAASDRHEEAGSELQAAVDAFALLRYPYELALAQTDLAAWLIGQGRADEVTALLDEAIATFERLGAAPALTRARSLQPEAAAQPTVEA